MSARHDARLRHQPQLPYVSFQSEERASFLGQRGFVSIARTGGTITQEVVAKQDEDVWKLCVSKATRSQRALLRESLLLIECRPALLQCCCISL